MLAEMLMFLLLGLGMFDVKHAFTEGIKGLSLENPGVNLTFSKHHQVNNHL